MDSRAILRNPRQELLSQLAAQLSTSTHRTIWLDRPYNLYLVKAQSEAYMAMMSSSSYAEPFHDPVKLLLERNCSNIARRARPPVDLIDLGPGYPDKTFPFFDFFNFNKISCRYVPVDINREFLRIAVSAAQDRNVEVKPQNCLFEELPSRINDSAFGGNSRIVLLGLTFMNYRPNFIKETLSKLIRPGDQLLVATQLLQDSNLGQLVDPYLSEPVGKFTSLVLDLLGLKFSSFRYFARFKNHRVEVGFRTVEPVTIESLPQISEGRDIVVAVSYRYRLEEFIQLLERFFSSVQVFCLKGSAVAVGRASSRK
jgi:uncharacterized SAM-dependent methyltransferase